MNPDDQSPSGDENLDALLRHHGGLKGLSRELGQDATASEYDLPANDNADARLRFWRRIWNSTCAPVLGLWIVLGYPVACFVLLWDEHHPWLVRKYPVVGIAALISFLGPLAIVGLMYWRWQNARGRS